MMRDYIRPIRSLWESAIDCAVDTYKSAPVFVQLKDRGGYALGWRAPIWPVYLPHVYPTVDLIYESDHISGRRAYAQGPHNRERIIPVAMLEIESGSMSLRYQLGAPCTRQLHRWTIVYNTATARDFIDQNRVAIIEGSAWCAMVYKKLRLIPG